MPDSIDTPYGVIKVGDTVEERGGGTYKVTRVSFKAPSPEAPSFFADYQINQGWYDNNSKAKDYIHWNGGGGSHRYDIVKINGIPVKRGDPIPQSDLVKINNFPKNLLLLT